MRLSMQEHNAIVQAVKGFDPQARIYLFGSRVDDAGKGGDIDILVFSKKLTFDDKLQIKAKLFATIEEQKIDILIAQDTSEPFVQMAFEDGVELK